MTLIDHVARYVALKRRLGYCIRIAPDSSGRQSRGRRSVSVRPTASRRR